jgi:hypothetical protein
MGAFTFIGQTVFFLGAMVVLAIWLPLKLLQAFTEYVLPGVEALWLALMWKAGF